MTHILQLSRDDPVIHLKAYGGVRIKGVDQAEVQCEISAPQLATLVEEDGHVYITVNSSCRLTVPTAASIEIERGMGSVKIVNLHNHIKIEKVLGNLVLLEINDAVIEKVGGNFSVSKASGSVQIEKVAGNLVVDEVFSFACEKIGGNCHAKSITNDFSLEKAGGQFLGQEIGGLTNVSKLGGSFKARNVLLGGDLKVGGTIKLADFRLENDLSLKAGGNIELILAEDLDNTAFSIRSGDQNIKIKVGEDDIEVVDYTYDYQLGEAQRSLLLAAGGSVAVLDGPKPEDDLIGDLSDHFDYEESAFSELIQERVDSATRKAEAKIRAAELRLGQIRERVEQHRGFNVDVDFDREAQGEGLHYPGQPEPPDTRPVGKKGASDEERLMILQMLQEKKITVDEAETLFKAMEN